LTSALADSVFCQHDRVHQLGTPGGVLDGLNFVVKDVMRVAGARACCGNPTWLDTHGAADAHAPVVQQLLDAGAELSGLVLSDELTLSLTGENAHYGTPPNAAAPGRVSGGSSSGSAAAVALGLASFALGTDTGGSVRVPASYCGIYGMRPTHGRIDNEGVVPLCTAFDTVGWFARDVGTLRRVGACLFGSWTAAPPLRVRLLLEDAIELLAPATRAAFETSCGSRFDDLERVRLTDFGLPPLAHWAQTYLTIQNAALWNEHHLWLSEHRPLFGPLIQRRFDRLSPPRPAHLAEAESDMRRLHRCVSRLLEGGVAMIVPSASDAAHPRDLPIADIDAITGAGLSLSSIASLCGLPQVSLPLASAAGLPLGLGLIGAAGSDEALLDLSCRIEVA
jgi:amidase